MQSDEYTDISFHLDGETLIQRIGMAWDHTAQSRAELARAHPAPSFPSHAAPSWASLPCSPYLPQDLHPVSLFGRLSPQLIFCDPQSPTWPQTRVRQTLLERMERVCMGRTLCAHTSSCRFVGSSISHLWRNTEKPSRWAQIRCEVAKSNHSGILHTAHGRHH